MMLKYGPVNLLSQIIYGLLRLGIVYVFSFFKLLSLVGTLLCDSLYGPISIAEYLKPEMAPPSIVVSPDRG